MKTPIDMIIEERERQQSVEGWTIEHDDEQTDQSLAMAAALYASPEDNLMKIITCDSCNGTAHEIDPWPWWNKVQLINNGPIVNVRAWDKRKNHNKMKRLQIAGALIIAEMERIQRSEDKDIVKEPRSI